MLSVYNLIEPPELWKCEGIEEKPPLDLSEFRQIFHKDDSDPSHHEQLKAKLDGLVETGDWDLDDAIQDSQTSADVDAVLYYIREFFTRRMKTMLTCKICR